MSGQQPGREPVEHLSEEDLSALVDGSPVGVEAAGHAAACPECAARLSRWQASRARLGEAVPVPAGARDAAVGAALGASGSMMDAIARLDDERARSRRGYERWKVLSRVAAAAVVMSAAGFGLSRLSSSSPKAASSAPAAAGSPTSSAASAGRGSGPSAQAGHGPAVGSAAGPAVGSAAGPAVGSAPPVSLGVLSGPADLTRAVRAALDSGSYQGAGSSPTTGSFKTAEPAANAPALCRAPVVGTGSHLLLVGDAVYQHTPAVVYVVQTGAARIATVYGDSDCRILLRTAV